jgi:hypothetical protein
VQIMHKFKPVPFPVMYEVVVAEFAHTTQRGTNLCLSPLCIILNFLVFREKSRYLFVISMIMLIFVSQNSDIKLGDGKAIYNN